MKTKTTISIIINMFGEERINMSANLHKHKPPISATRPILRDNAEIICFVRILPDLIRVEKAKTKTHRKIRIALLSDENCDGQDFEIMNRLCYCFEAVCFEEVCRMD